MVKSMGSGAKSDPGPLHPRLGKQVLVSDRGQEEQECHRQVTAHESDITGTEEPRATNNLGTLGGSSEIPQ